MVKYVTSLAACVVDVFSVSADSGLGSGGFEGSLEGASLFQIEMVMYWKCWLSSLWPAAVFIASIATAVEDTTSPTATTGTVSSQNG